MRWAAVLLLALPLLAADATPPRREILRGAALSGLFDDLVAIAASIRTRKNGRYDRPSHGARKICRQSPAVDAWPGLETCSTRSPDFLFFT